MVNSGQDLKLFVRRDPLFTRFFNLHCGYNLEKTGTRLTNKRPSINEGRFMCVQMLYLNLNASKCRSTFS